mgnify:FL=1
MTEKLTYDPTPADAPELSEEEQNSLEVAEKLGEEEAKQYAGKFENADELEKAYLELQKKLGSDDEEKSDDEPEAEAEKPEEPEESPATTLINDASKEWSDNDGKLSEETMAKFSEMSSQDLVQAYMDIQANAPQKAEPAAVDLTDKEVSDIQQSVGGEEDYNKMISWASESMEKPQLDAFNRIINSGGYEAVKIAVAGMRAAYENSEGYEGKMLVGKGPATSSDTFRSQAEVVKALGDPRYDKDPAYRQDIYDKLERSNLQF